jgi:transposase InsO family protein
MKSWFTVAELAELNLPGLPASSRGVLKFADREGWADQTATDGRFNLYLVVDIYSRRIMALVSQTPTTEASLQLVRRAIIEWGVPETLRTDNGSDFTSYRFKRALNSLAIEHDITAPFSPEQKGTVERHIGTLQRGLMPLLPGFIGHSVEDRKKIEARRAFAQRLGASDDKAFCVDMDAGELQTVIDAWCAGTYGHNGHGGLDGETPFNRAAAYRGTVRRIENARPLDMLLAPVAGNDGFRTVTKRGIRLDGAHFHNGLLPVGEQVFCRCDPEDMGRLYVFEADGGAFICEAICDERVGVDPKAAAAAARNLQSRVLKDGIAEARKEARTIKSRDFVESVKRQADQNHGNVAAFPHRSEPHVTGDLYAAEIAAETERRAPVELTEAQKQRHEKLKAEIEGGGGNVVALPETAKQRFKRAMEIREALERSEQVPPEEARWLGSYEGSAEYRSQSTMVDAFGKSWLEA